MKRLITFIVLIAMSLSLVSCKMLGSKDNNESQVTFAGLTEVPKFELEDINGKKFTDDIFKDNKITVINIWGTFCGPCIEELPMLEELNKEWKNKNIAIIGIVSDAKKDDAIKILNEAKVTYTNLIPDDKFKKNFVDKTVGVPTTILVDSEGNILDSVVGAKDKEQYKNLVDTNLK